MSRKRFVAFIMALSMIFTLMAPGFAFANVSSGYYLIGERTGWQNNLDAAIPMGIGDSENKAIINKIWLNKDETWKIVRVNENGSIPDECWYGRGSDNNNYVVPADGYYKIYLNNSYRLYAQGYYEAIVSNSIEHGSVSVSPTGEQLSGTRIDLTATPDDCYTLNSFSVVTANHGTQLINYQNTNYYLVPDSDVYVSATFTGPNHSWSFNGFTWSQTQGEAPTAVANYKCSNCQETTSVTATVGQGTVSGNATCTTAGQTDYVATIAANDSLDGVEHVSTATSEDFHDTNNPPATGHTWEFVDFTWTGFTAVANYVCNNNNAHTTTVNADITSEVTTAATCGAAGVRTYTATVTAEVSLDGAAHTDGNHPTETINATGSHTWDYDHPTWGAEPVEDGFAYKVSLTFSCQNCDATRVVYATSGMVGEEDASCTEGGYKESYFSATVDGHQYRKEYTWDVTEPDPDCHVFHTTIERLEATCTEPGNIKYYRCASCGKYFSDAACKHEITVNDTIIPAFGHVEVADAAVAATCTETGLTAGSHCSRCGAVLVAQQVTEALGHTWSAWTYNENNATRTCACGTTETAAKPTANIAYAQNPEAVAFNGGTVQLAKEATFTFAEELTKEQSDAFGNFYCDYIVYADHNVPANTMGFYGYYGTYGEPVSFVNPEAVSANTEIPLVHSLFDATLTLNNVSTFVREFTCGVFDTDYANAGTTLTVELRIWNPADETQKYTIQTMTHTFASAPAPEIHVPAANAEGNTDTQLTATIEDGVFTADAVADVPVVGQAATVTFNAAAAQALAAQDADLTLSVQVEDGEAGAKLYTITLNKDNANVFTGGGDQKATITVPFTVAEGKLPKVFLVDGQTLTPVTVTGYTDNSITFEVLHFSTYQVQTVNSVASYTDANDATVYTDSLAEAISNAKANSTITLLANVSTAVNIDNGKTFTIDLAGHTMGRLNLRNAFVTVKDTAETKGKITDSVYVYATDDNTKGVGAYNSFTLDASATIDTHYGIILCDATGNTGYGSQINIAGTVLGNVWVMGNIKNGNSVINVSGTVNARGKSDVGIALNGNVTVNVLSGASVTSEDANGKGTGIELRAGTLNVSSGSTITGHGAPASATANGNGTTSTGAGIAVSTYDNSPIVLNVEGGTISGYSPLYLTNTTGTTKTMTLSVSGGTFTTTDGGTVAIARDESNPETRAINFVSGGSFSSAVPEEYCANGYIPEATTVNNVTTYGVKQGAYVAQIGAVKYETLAAAVAAAVDGNTITLLANATGAGLFVGPNRFTSTGLTIDFNDYTYTVETPVGSSGTVNQALHFEQGNKITLTGGTINITSDTAKRAAFEMFMQNYCALTISGMTMDGTGIAVATYSDPKYQAYPEWYQTAKPQFNYNTAGNSVISSSTITMPGALGIDDAAALTIENDAIINVSAIATKGTDERYASSNATITVENGARFTLTGTGAGAAFEALLAANGQSLGTAVNGVYTVDSIKVAQIGSTKYATLDDAIAAADSSGSVITLLENAELGTSPITKSFKIESNGKKVTLTGNVTINHSKTIIVYTDLTIDLAGHTITATGSGKFQCGEYYHKESTLTIVDSATGGRITGGNYSSAPLTQFGNGSVIKLKNDVAVSGTYLGITSGGGQIIVEDTATVYGGTYGVKNTATSDGVTELTYSGNAITGGTQVAWGPAEVTVGDKTYYAKTVSGLVNNKVPADGNEYTITAYSSDADLSGTVIQNGQKVIVDLNGQTVGLRDELKINEGHLTIKNGTVTNSGTRLIQVFASDDTTKAAGEYNSLTIESNATVTTTIVVYPYGYGTANETNKAYGTKVTINGAIVGTSSGGVSINGVAHEGNSVIDVNGSITNASSHAMYLAGCGITNINDGATVTGSSTGVEVRAGTLNVTGGAITGGTGTPDYSANDGGSSTTNAGIAVAQHVTKLPITVNVSGSPAVTGGSALYIVNPQNNTETTNAIAVNISDTPTFDGTTVTGDDRAVLTVSGGMFETPVRVNDCAAGYYPVNDTESSTYTVSNAVAALVYNETNGRDAGIAYATFAAAVEAAASGDIIELLANVTLTAPTDSTIVINKNLTINLNNHNITAANARALHIQSGAVEITGTGTITSTHTEGNSWSKDSSVIRVGNSGAAKAKLTIGAGVTVAAPYSYGITVFGTNTAGVELVVNGTVAATGLNGAISGNGNSGNKGAVTINAGATVSSTVDAAIYHPQNDTLTINGGTITGPAAVYVKSGTVEINGGILTATAAAAAYSYNGNGCNATGDALVVDNCNYPGGAPTVTISGGTFTSDHGDGIGSYAGNNATTLATVTATGDTIDVGDDFKWVGDAQNGYTLVKKVYVAEIDGQGYETLAAAIAAVPAGTQTTITMIADETFNDNLGVTIPQGRSIILDLNGHELRQYAPNASVSHLIENLGTLTIKDSTDTDKNGNGTGKMYSEAAQPSSAYSYATNLISNRGNLTIESGYFESHTNYASYVVDNYPGGTLTVTGGHLYNYFTSAIRLFCNSTTLDNVVNVEGGVIDGYCAIWMQSPNNNNNNGTLNISGGTINTTEKAVVEGTKEIYNGSSYLYAYPSSANMSMNISGGTLNTNVCTWGDLSESITGGTFNGRVYAANATHFISDGDFVKKPTADYIAEDKAASSYIYDSATNTYRYTIDDAVAQIDDIGYLTLADALADAADGNTIKLLADSTGAGLFIEPNTFTENGLTIDFNGKTYTVETPVGSTGTENQALHFESGNKITLTGGTINMTNDATALAAFEMFMQNYGILVIDDMAIDGTGIAIATYSDPKYQKYTEWYNTEKPQFNFNTEGTSVIRNSTITMPGALGVDDAAVLNIEDDAVINVSAIATKGTDDRYTGTSVVNAENGAKFKLTGNGAVATFETYLAAKGQSLGTAGANGVYTVETLKVAQIVRGGETLKFASLAEAVTAAQAGETVTLLADVEQTSVIDLTKNLTLDLNGKTINGQHQNNASWIRVTNDAILTINGTGATVYGRIELGVATNNNGNVVINGGTYIRNNGTVLHINGTCLDSDVTITGATMTSNGDNGIQLNGSGTFVIENSTITGATGVYVKSGVLTITGSTITGNMNPANYSYNGNGANATGDAIVIDSCNYPGGAPTVTIGAGNTFSGTKKQVGYYEALGSGTVLTPGTVTATTNDLTIPADYKWVAQGTDPETYDLVKKVYVAEVNGTGYETFAEAWAAANETANSTMTLLADVALTAQYNATGNFTLDLNGHNIATTHRLRLEKGTLNIVNSANTQANPTTNTITTSNSGMAPVDVRFDKTNDATAKRTLTIGAGVELVGPCYGLNIFGTNEETVANDIDVTIDGKVNGMLFVLGNLKNTNNSIDIVVNGTVDASNATGEEAVHTGIAANGYANVIVNNGAIVKGDSGIEVRAGSLTVNGGTITATAQSYSYTPNGSGTTTKGAAIAVAQHTTVLATNVTLNGGTLTGGVKQIAVTDVNNNDLAGVTVIATESYTQNSMIPEDFEWVESGTAGTYTLEQVAVTNTTVTFNANGGKFGDDSTQKTANAVVGAPIQAANIPDDPTRIGYSFVGWFEATDTTTTPVTLSNTAFDFTGNITAETTLYAKWQGDTTFFTKSMKAYTTASLNESINLNLYIYNLPEGTTITDYSVRVTFNGSTHTFTYAESDVTTEAGKYRHALVETYAYQMTMPISYTLIYNNEVEFYTNADNSVMKYMLARYDANDASDKEKDLMKAALDYGAAAQEYFAYRYVTDVAHLANAITNPTNVINATRPDQSSKLSNGAGLTYLAAYMVYDSVNSIRIRIGNLESLEGVTFTLDGEGFTMANPVSEGNGRYMIQISGLTSPKLGERFTLNMTRGGSTTSYTFSGYVYANRMWDSQTDGKLSQALVAYGDAAKVFFG